MKTLFNDNWLFTRKPVGASIEEFYETNDFLPVDIPHDWLIYDVTDVYAENVACYKKSFFVDSLGTDKLSILFEGVYMNNDIYLNGKKIFEWKYGYSEFEVDITDYVIEGENTIYVTNTIQIPNSRWYAGAGIYRNVWLIRKPAIHFTHNGGYFSAQKIDDNDWSVHLDFEVKNTSDSAKEISIKHTAKDADGNELFFNLSSFNAEKNITVCKDEITVESPDLWDIESPNLYNLYSELIIDNEVVDTANMRVGFKDFRFDPNEGFFLNDKHVKINGSCEHHTLGALGAAMNKTALLRQLEILKSMGVNSIRSAHNMPSTELIDLCDELGLLLFSESFDMWEQKKTDYDYGLYFNEWWKKDLTSWVRHDRNHASLFILGIGNEIHDVHDERGLEITKMLRDAVKEIDYYGNAVIGMGSNLMEWDGAIKCTDEIDLAGYNYMDHLYDEHHQKHPDWCIFGSETSSTVQSRGVYHFPLSNRLLTYEDGQCSSLGNCTTNWGAKNSDHVITAHRDREFVWGQYIWSGFDYIGEPTPYFTKNSYFGQIDTAGFPKDTFYSYQAEWTDYKTNPMCHLFPYWDFNEGQIIDVRVFSNAPKVELFFDKGKTGNFVSMGCQTIDHEKGLDLSGTWQLAYSYGTIKTVAYDEDGNIIAEDIHTSFGDAKKITLTPNKDSLKADGEDLIFVEINTVDADGNYVENSRSRVNVTVTGAGRLIGLDNGDSTDYEQYKSSCRKLFNGKLLAIIAGKDSEGTIDIKVTSPGLEEASLRLHAKEAQFTKGHSTVFEENTLAVDEKILNEIPVRKIELKNLGTNSFDENIQETTVVANIYPANATFDDLTFKALTLDGVESTSVTIDTEGNEAHITARGDGDFRLVCACKNGSEEFSEILSELEFSATGLGEANLIPYKLINGINNTGCSAEAKLSFQGGVYITSTERTEFWFDNVDFGEYGSDEIHVPIFSFQDVLPIEIWLGRMDEGELLFSGNYEAKSWYNHYQENTFKLKKRIQGLQTISIVVIPEIKMSLGGFYFTEYEKAFGQLFATENNQITGDAFTVEEDAITGIGNNVTLEYENMDFSQKQPSSITICGHSPIESNSIHVRFYDEEGNSVNQIVEFSYSEDYKEMTFNIDGFTGNGKVNLIFMPGSKFDLKWFKFE